MNEDGSIDLIQTEEQNTGYLKTYRETLDQAIAAYTASSSNQLNEITVSDDYSTVTAVLDGTAESQQDISVCTMMAVYAEIGQIYSGIAEEDIRIYVKIQNNSHIVIDQIIFPDDISE